MSFSTTYIETKDDVSDKNSPIKLQKVNSRYDKNIIMISRIIKKKHFYNDQHFLQYVRTKHINIIDPYEYFIREKDEYALVFKDYRQYRFPEQILYQSNETFLKIILFQIALTLDDFQKRNIKWYISSLSQIYLIDNKNVFLSMLDFEDTYFKEDYKNFDGFFNLIKYISYQRNLLMNLLSKNNFKEIIHELQANLTEPQQSFLNFKDLQELLIKQMINIYFTPSQEQIEQAGDYNIINVQTPNFLKIIFDINQEQLQYRFYIFKEFGSQQEINQDREIEYQYKSIASDHVEQIICYFKIHERVIFFYKKPYSSLKQAFDNIKKENKQIDKKICFKILKDLLLGIYHLHQNNIIHRNLSPETCFLAKEKLDEQNTYFIGYIGTSKQLKDTKDRVLQTNDNCQLFDYFMPPEDISQYSKKTDVFLFGLLALYVMNQGEMLCNNSELGKKQYQENFSSQNIQNKLQGYNYDKALIDMVSSCLEFEPEKRPTIDDIQKTFHSLDQSQKIKVLPKQQVDGGQNF